jgi:hypothetical protein
MSKIDELRTNLTEDQRRVINTTWIYELEKNTQIPTSALYHRLGKDMAASALKSLNGSIVREYSGNGTPRCGLTFLGKLLTDQGEEGKDLLTKVLSYVQSNLRTDPEFNEISSEKLKEGFDFTDDQIHTLWQYLFHSPFSGGGGGGSSGGWKFGVSYYMRNDLPLEEDLSVYFEKYALEEYDPNLPVLYNERNQYLTDKNKGSVRSEFWFITDADLQKLLEQDWQEAQRVQGVGAWKSCLLLCGSILEGILMNALNQDWVNSSAEFSRRKKKPAPPVNEWDLVDLVEVANRLRMFPKGTIYLSNAVREFRNLIHPGRQIREHIQVTEEQATIAINSVRILLQP